LRKWLRYDIFNVGMNFFVFPWWT